MPGMVWRMGAVLFLDALALQVLLTTQEPVLVLFGVLWIYLGPLMVGMGGALHAASWMALSSPWQLPPREGLEPASGPWRNAKELMSRCGPPDLAVIILRLMSGCCVSFAALYLFFKHYPPGWEGESIMLLLLLQLQLARLAPLRLASLILAPVMLIAARGRAGAWLHAVLAMGTVTFVLSNESADTAYGLAAWALLLPAYPYGLMVGGCAWWKLSRLSAWMGRPYAG